MKTSLRFMGNWNAKKIAICLLMIAGVSFSSFGQRFEWAADAYTFMDNQSFGGSLYSTRTIISGFRISPEIGLSWAEGQHRIMVGSHLMKEFGTTLHRLLRIQEKRRQSAQSSFVWSLPPRRTAGQLFRIILL